MKTTMNRGFDHRHDEDIGRVAEHADEIERKFAKQRALRQWAEHGKLLLKMIRDYIRGAYREVPYWAISAIALALLYVLNPLDVIPDLFPGFGYLDDATVLAFCLKLIEQELHKYKAWLEARERQGPVIDIEI